jgi:two-component system CheB/CheR fusion protein
MLGSSESIGNATDLFSPLDATHRLFVRRPEQYARHKRLELPLSGSLVDTSPRQTRSTSEKPLQRRIEQYLLDAHTPEAVFVDEERTIVYFHGRTGQLFEPARGVPRTNISDMAREGLRGELSTALTETSGANEVTVRTNVRVRADGGEISVDFEVIPLSADVGLQDMYAVVFTRIAPIAEAREEQPKPAVSPSEDGEPSRVEALEAELVATKERLQSTVEQLETSNEEVKSSLEEYQSTNEELQSSNEELESSKEEMQSLNEELSTVNQELQDKNQEISRAYEEMKNYLDNVEIPIVFVDTGMRVKRFNESATEIINLIASDVNRPLSQITTNVHYEELVDDVDEAIRKARYHEVVIEHNNGERYWVRIAPYKNIDNVVEGALVTFVPFPPSNLKNGR